MTKKKKIEVVEEVVELVGLVEPTEDFPEEEVEVALVLEDVSIEVVPDEIPEAEPLPQIETVPVEPEQVRIESTAGQGSWHKKYNTARGRKSVAARKYIPVHRQR